MWNKGKFIYLRVVTPQVKWIRFYIPLYVFNELFECLVDLVALGAMIAPRVTFNKKGLSMVNVYHMLLGVERIVGNIYLASQEELVNVSIGSKETQIIIKVI